MPGRRARRRAASRWRADRACGASHGAICPPPTRPCARAPAPAHVSLVVVGPTTRGPSRMPDQQPAGLLRRRCGQFFDDRRILTTRHHVVGPEFLPVEISANLALPETPRRMRRSQAAQPGAAELLRPADRRPDRRAGRSAGRCTHRRSPPCSRGLSLVDYVEDVQLTAPANPDRVQSGETGDASAPWPWASNWTLMRLVRLRRQPWWPTTSHGRAVQQPHDRSRTPARPARPDPLPAAISATCRRSSGRIRSPAGSCWPSRRC